ncbi:GNAT family N-acetyltransferase [Ktedonospora formicarum]|uniref:Putative acetyltransferase, GNAT n=1 Tax=Ktedonospora formicarum TaxID=2778364 RepID=A0A8J3MVR1_9CHLR|nr:GNAT family N-acetyltransferase [Ktedonospora formicarum]GHO46775.1 putative acetyltransferase, GNAT [Ktedonospora formicarum]
MPATFSLASEYKGRAPVHEDIPAIIALMHAHDVAEAGGGEMEEESSILASWEKLNLETDAWLITTTEGFVCGYATLTVEDAGRILADGYVHPEHYGRGIGTAIISFTESRARELIADQPEDIRLVLVNNIVANNEPAINLLESSHYSLTRVFFRMAIMMETSPTLSAFPEGITIRMSDGSPEEIRYAYDTIEEGFRDHWGHAPQDYDEWRKHMVTETFDPTLWFFAEDGNRIVGAALCREREEGDGWIARLAVLRSWRKRGLGIALLTNAFHAFYQHGIKRVGLAVDGQSLTGAQRLYERAGMSVTMRIGRYEKELRPGKDLLP